MAMTAKQIEEQNKRVQFRLKQLGYDVGNSGVDGVIGRDTQTAIAAFQRDHGLNVQWPGTVGPKTLAALFGDTAPVARPIWYDEALRRVGLHESNNNAELRRYLKSDGATLGDPSKLPWCGDFVETPIALTLPKEPLPNNPYWAQNWLKFGLATYGSLADQLAKPHLGAVAVFKRPNGGHVGFVAGHDRTYFHILGGNQSNRVSITKIAKSRCLGLRWPKTFDFVGDPLPYTTLNATISTNEA